MDTAENIADLIVETPGTCGGRPRVAGLRITVENVAIWHERMGMSADRICSEYSLTLSQVYAALAYYFENRESIDRRIKDGAEFVERMERESDPSLVEKYRQTKRSA